jgi:hypothetical protein
MEEGSEASDSEILSAVRDAEESTLDSAMERAGRDAQSSLEDSAAILQDARKELKASLLDLKALALRQPAYEEELDALLLSSQLLDAKAGSFQAGASSAALSAPEVDEETLSARRTAYRPKDRGRDLVRAGDSLKKAAARFKRAPALSASEGPLLDALAACLSEVRHAEQALKTASERIVSAKKEEVSKREAARKEGMFTDRIERLSEDAEGLAVEVRLLDAYLKLRRIDEESFDQSGGR